MKKQRADDAEKALLQIKNKIEQARLTELNQDIRFLMDPTNPELYCASEAVQNYEKLKRDFEQDLQRTDFSKLVRPFLIDKKVVSYNQGKVEFSQMKEQSNVIQADIESNK